MKRALLLLAVGLAACDFDTRMRTYCTETGLCPDSGTAGAGGAGGSGGAAGGTGGSGGSGGGTGGSVGGSGGGSGGSGGGSGGSGGGGGLPAGTCSFVSIRNTAPSTLGVHQCNTFAGGVDLDGGGQDTDCNLPFISLASTPTPGLQLFGSGCSGGATSVTRGGITGSVWASRFGTFTWWLVVTDSRGTFVGLVKAIVVNASMTEDAGSAAFTVGTCTDVEIRAVDFNSAPAAAADVELVVPTVLSGSGTVGSAGCGLAQPFFAAGSTTLTLGVRPSASGTLTFSLDGSQTLGTHNVSVAVP